VVMAAIGVYSMVGFLSYRETVPGSVVTLLQH